MKFYFNNNEISKEEAIKYYERHLSENIGATVFEQDLARLEKYLEQGDSSYFWNLEFRKI